MNEMNVTFSIIVLSHNNEHISLVIQSILSQINRYDEIILVDDHSETKHLQDLELFANRNNIKIIKAEKYGNRSHNRNLGAHAAVGNVLIFMDGDMVLIDNALSILRYAHTYQKEGAFVGPKHNIHYDPIHFELYTGIKNYIELLKTPEGRKILSEDFFSLDEREKFFEDYSNRRYFWMHYYTGASSVRRDIFEKCGGFDENFTTWGSEDIELGYRISRNCEIGFLKDFHSFHIPHGRDAFEVETTNMANTMYMLTKHKSWEFEVLYAFNGNPDIHKSFFNMVTQMRSLSLEPIQRLDSECYLIINAISQKYPQGNIISHIYAKTEEHNLIGLALPFKNGVFDDVCILDHIFIYPPVVVSRILQEAIRVGKNVYIKNTETSFRINWSGKLFFPDMSSNHRIAYRSEDIMDYSFEVEGDKIHVLPALPEYVMRSPKFLES